MKNLLSWITDVIISFIRVIYKGYLPYLYYFILKKWGYEERRVKSQLPQHRYSNLIKPWEIIQNHSVV